MNTDVKNNDDPPKTSTQNSLNAASYTEGQQSVIYRIYVPDINTAPTGGVSLPVPILTLNNGEVLRGDDACKLLNTR